jgi:polar amino acid transport system substrate-binding protein
MQTFAKKEITLYTYHLKPPFITNLEKKEGLSFDLVKLLNNNNKKVHYKVRYIPRLRLEKDIMINNPSPILWVSPIWFKDKSKYKFNWSDVILKDRDVFISLNKRFNYTGPSSVIGQYIILTRGFFYHGLQALMKEKKISPLLLDSETQSFKMIASGRGGLSIISESTLSYLLLSESLETRDKIKVAKNPHDSYNRSILLPKHKKTIYKDLNNRISRLKNNPLWLKLLKKYNLK